MKLSTFSNNILPAILALTLPSMVYAADECKELDKKIRIIRGAIQSDQEGIKSYNDIVKDLNAFSRGTAMSAIKGTIDTKLSASEHGKKIFGSADEAENINKLREKLTKLFVDRLTVDENIDYWKKIAKPTILFTPNLASADYLSNSMKKIQTLKSQITAQLDQMASESTQSISKEIEKDTTAIKEYTWGLRGKVDSFKDVAINVSNMESNLARQKSQLELNKFIETNFLELQKSTANFCKKQVSELQPSLLPSLLSSSNEAKPNGSVIESHTKTKHSPNASVILSEESYYNASATKAN